MGFINIILKEIKEMERTCPRCHKIENSSLLTGRFVSNRCSCGYIYNLNLKEECLIVKKLKNISEMIENSDMEDYIKTVLHNGESVYQHLCKEFLNLFYYFSLNEDITEHHIQYVSELFQKNFKSIDECCMNYDIREIPVSIKIFCEFDKKYSKNKNWIFSESYVLQNSIMVLMCSFIRCCYNMNREKFRPIYNYIGMIENYLKKNLSGLYVLDVGYGFSGGYETFIAIFDKEYLRLKEVYNWCASQKKIILKACENMECEALNILGEEFEQNLFEKLNIKKEEYSGFYDFEVGNYFSIYQMPSAHSERIKKIDEILNEAIKESFGTYAENKAKEEGFFNPDEYYTEFGEKVIEYFSEGNDEKPTKMWIFSENDAETITEEIENNQQKEDILEEDGLLELQELTGLERIKEDVSDLIKLVKVQQKRRSMGLPSVPVSLHLVFSGNPGTGKTTVARIIAKIYKQIGVLSKGQLIEVDRASLVAGYVGQTAIKTMEKIKEAKGGVLFIDEAYSLNKEGNDYGQEAIDTILKAMEDYREDFVVIVAGYKELMERFINSNPGLKSRFNKYIEFDDYNENELVQIFCSMCRKHGYVVTDDALSKVQEKIKCMLKNKDENFANARDIRNLFEVIITNQANRAIDMDLEGDEFITISSDDIDR